MNKEGLCIEIPTDCPSCGTGLDLDNGQLFCRNPECASQLLKALMHFTKVLKIKGLGEKTIERLGFARIKDIYDSSKEKYVHDLGEKTGTKIYEEVEASKFADLGLILQALNIPSIGETASAKVARTVKHIDEIDETACKKAGLGNVATRNLLTWLSENIDTVKELPFKFESINYTSTVNPGTVIANVCITGKLNDFKNRADAINHLTKFGFKVTESTSSKTNFLICEEDRNSSKKEWAINNNIPILTIKELKERFNIYE